MDLISGISAATQAVQLVKELRSIDRSVDEASFKLKLAELMEALANTKIALSEARELLSEKDAEIRELKLRLDVVNSGEACPICQMGRLKVTASRAHPVFGTFGHQERTLTCTNADCGHSEKRKYDPSGKS